MSEIKVNKISPRTNCGTVTLGDSGDTIAIGAGVTTSGMGRTGTVDWVTTKKTGDFTAVNGEGYFVDTSSGTITATLPSSPSAGNIVGFKDYAGTFGNNALTLNRNGSNVAGVGSNQTLNTNNQSVFLVYVDATQGWIPTQDDTSNLGALFVAASGGNATITCGNFKTHIFTGPGTFTVSCGGNSRGSSSVDYFVVAGGASGGVGCASGGGGAGGFRLSNSPLNAICSSSMSPLANPTGLPVTAQAYPIVVGAGGASRPSSPTGPGNAGNVSSFSSIASAGGGTGGGCPGGPPSCRGGGTGGSGGGGAHNGGSGAAGNTPPVSPPQGNAGGDSAPSSTPPNDDQGGGGGGSGAVGGTVPPQGGAGSFIDVNIIGPTAPSYGEAGPVSGTRYFGGGGGGGHRAPGAAPGVTDGGVGGGGNGGRGTNQAGTAAVANTGGGGGGGTGPTGHAASGAGGSGIVMIRYKFQ